MSLTNDDLKKIGDVVNSSVFSAFSSVWEHNLELVLNEIFSTMATQKQLGEMEVRLEARLSEKIGKKVDDARDYIDRKIGEYSGDSVSRDKTIIVKADTTVERLGERHVFPPETVSEIQSISPFPAAPTI